MDTGKVRVLSIDQARHSHYMKAYFRIRYLDEENDFIIVAEWFWGRFQLLSSTVNRPRHCLKAIKNHLYRLLKERKDCFDDYEHSGRFGHGPNRVRNIEVLRCAISDHGYGYMVNQDFCRLGAPAESKEASRVERVLEVHDVLSKPDGEIMRQLKQEFPKFFFEIPVFDNQTRWTVEQVFGTRKDRARVQSFIMADAIESPTMVVRSACPTFHFNRYSADVKLFIDQADLPFDQRSPSVSELMMKPAQEKPSRSPLVDDLRLFEVEKPIYNKGVIPKVCLQNQIWNATKEKPDTKVVIMPMSHISRDLRAEFGDYYSEDEKIHTVDQLPTKFHSDEEREEILRVNRIRPNLKEHYISFKPDEDDIHRHYVYKDVPCTLEDYKWDLTDGNCKLQ